MALYPILHNSYNNYGSPITFSELDYSIKSKVDEASVTYDNEQVTYNNVAIQVIGIINNDEDIEVTQTILFNKVSNKNIESYPTELVDQSYTIYTRVIEILTYNTILSLHNHYGFPRANKYLYCDNEEGYLSVNIGVDAVTGKYKLGDGTYNPKVSCETNVAHWTSALDNIATAYSGWTHTLIPLDSLIKISKQLIHPSFIGDHISFSTISERELVEDKEPAKMYLDYVEMKFNGIYMNYLQLLGTYSYQTIELDSCDAIYQITIVAFHVGSASTYKEYHFECVTGVDSIMKVGFNQYIVVTTFNKILIYVDPAQEYPPKYFRIKSCIKLDW